MSTDTGTLRAAIDDVTGELNAVVSQMIAVLRTSHDHILTVRPAACRHCLMVGQVMDAHHHAAAALRGLRRTLE